MTEATELLADIQNELTEEDNEDGDLFSGMPSEALAELTPAKTRMILLYLTGQYTFSKIATIVGVAPITIRAWLNQPLVQDVIRELQTREFKVIDSSLRALRLKAVETMDDLMDSPMDAVRFQASKDILDRTGHKAVTELKVDKTVTTIEKQLRDLADVTIDEAEVIDITDIVDQVRRDYEQKS